MRIAAFFKALIGRVMKRTEAGCTDFCFKFQQYPLGEWHFFTITARDQAAANVLATRHFEGLFDRHLTVMTSFYPATTT